MTLNMEDFVVDQKPNNLNHNFVEIKMENYDIVSSNCAFQEPVFQNSVQLNTVQIKEEYHCDLGVSAEASTNKFPQEVKSEVQEIEVEVYSTPRLQLCDGVYDIEQTIQSEEVRNSKLYFINVEKVLKSAVNCPRIITKAEKRSLQCSICENVFENAELLQEHQEFHFKENTLFHCAVCDKSFGRKCYLRIHIEKHKGDKPYKCEICRQGFNDRSNVRRHAATHWDKKVYKCNKCEKEYKYRYSLVAHMRLHDFDRTVPEKRYKCEICEKIFGSIAHLKEHLVSHTDERKFRCEFCQNTFKRKSSLNRHVRIHTGGDFGGLFSCKACGKFFRHKSDVKVHYRLHTGEKPYKCEECGKGFTVRCNLTKHKCKHTKRK